MTKLTVTVLLLLGVVVLYPPADRMKSVEEQEMLIKEGYTFIARTGGSVRMRFEEWLMGVATIATLGGAAILYRPIRSRMSPRSRRIFLKIISPLLILVPIVCLGVVALFGWVWTDSTTRGAWSKPQMQSDHLHSFFSFMLLFYWPQILASAAAIAAGVYLWPRRRPTV